MRRSPAISLTKGCPLQSALSVPRHRAEGDVLDALTVPLILAEHENDYEQHVQLAGRLVGGIVQPVTWTQP